MRVHITLKSANAKVGPIPVTTTESASCPSACPLQDKGCYAKSGPLAIHWRKVDSGERGMEWADFCQTIAKLPAGQLWRHNQAGDLPGSGDLVDMAKLSDLVQANTGKRGFTYTHYPVLDNDHNRTAVFGANAFGFTVNLSANTIAEADKLKALDIGPVVTLATPEDWAKDGKTCGTDRGNLVVRCPAEYRDTSCSDCRMCADSKRGFIVGFTAHGSSRKAVEVIARG